MRRRLRGLDEHRLTEWPSETVHPVDKSALV